MSDESPKNIKKLVFHAQYVSEDLEETQEKFMKFKEQFYKDFPDEYEKMMNRAKKLSKEEKDEEIEQEKKQKSKDMKKLYRRISKVTHPDKVDSDVLTRYFSDASEAYSEGDLATLFVIASTLNIDTSDIDSKDISEELEKYIQEGEAETRDIKLTLAWSWAHAETEEEKEAIKEIIRKHVEENY
tara:strand:+ start:1932 stop:2486 length:555 start_codon:yes stop_codon:yes gene_type:complete